MSRNKSISCLHIEHYKRVYGYRTFCLIHGFFVTYLSKESREEKAKKCQCRERECRSWNKRIHACLFCPYFGCFGGENHIHKHAPLKKHYLAIDTSFGFVYCFVCRDYKYDYQFENLAMRNEKIIASRKLEPVPYVHIPFRPWLRNLHLITPIYDEDNELEQDVGMRGIINMGNTCYMSCIFQALLHAPIITDYFLRYKHKCIFQPPKSLEEYSVTDHSVCFCCEIGEVVEEFYSGKTSFYVPRRFLYLFWIHVHTLAGYVMNDAQEFLFYLIDLIHQHCGDDHKLEPSEKLKNSKYCCVMDEIFTGISQTESICKECSKTTTVVDCFKFIPLDFLDWDALQKGIVVVPTLTHTLTKMVQDKLQVFNCKFCNRSQVQCFERKIMLKLPHILNFFLNRLNFNGRFVQKYNELIDFPDEIDMTPYIDFDTQDISLTNKYFLLAVVQHIGDASTGHYVTYVKKCSRWYKCNDENVSLIDFKIVKRIPAYSLIYHRKFSNEETIELINCKREISSKVV